MVRSCIDHEMNRYCIQLAPLSMENHAGPSYKRVLMGYIVSRDSLNFG